MNEDNIKKISLAAILFFSILFLVTKAEADSAVIFDSQENLAYNEFILPTYPDGLRANWNGVHANYLDGHANDTDWNKNHEVSTESTSLLAHYAALKGDQATFDQMYDLWSQESYSHYSQKFQLEHWLLDHLGIKLSTDGENYANASGEEVRMLEALRIADAKFIPTGGRNYRGLAIKLAEGLKGVNGGQGNFEPPYAYATESGDGGVDYIYFEPQNTRYIRINCLTRNTEWGYSLWEVEIYGPDTDSVNLALGANATTSSIQEPGLEANKTIDGNLATRWSSQFSDPQYLEIDLGTEKKVNEVVLHWETASAKSYNIDLNPYYVPKEADGYLLRPWFIWRIDDTPVSKPWDPIRVPLNYNNYVSYYYAANWLGDPFYQKVLDYTLGVVENSQTGKGLFKTIYELSTHQYLSEYGDNACTTIAGCDIATRIGAYGHLVSDPKAIDTGKLYLDFLKSKYINDGVIFASYDYDTGEPVATWRGFVLYSFFAKLAIEYGDYDLAEKIIREQILPYQVDDASDPGFDEGYYGAFKSLSTKYEAEQDIWKDASAFANLETLMTLHKWNNTDKGSWVSSYPLGWITVASVTNSDGGEDVVEFNSVNTRYLKILCKEHSLPDYGYSIFTLQIFGPDTTEDLASNKKVSASSVESYEYIPPKAVDGDDATRWSSEFVIDPQWIYVDLGATKIINEVRILWEAAYATDYEIQIIPTATITLNQPNGGQTLTGGKTYDIKWSCSGTIVDHIKLLYSTDAGLTYPNVITDNTLNDGVYIWTVPSLNSTTVRIKAIAEDSDNNVLVEDESDSNFTIVTNRPPVLESIGNKQINEGALLEFTISAQDPDGDTLSYSASNLPTGATFGSATQTFSWRPTYDQAGTYTGVKFTVSDDSLSDEETITITVNNVNGPPVLAPIGNKTVNRGEWLRFNVNASDPDNDRVTYGIFGKPQGASFNSVTGRFMWKPQIWQAGNFVVTFTARDTQGNQDSETITIFVPNTPPVLNPVGNKTVRAGRWLVFRLTASDADRIDRRGLKYYAENLPRGAILVRDIGMFLWRPTDLQRGSYRVRFWVKDPPGATDNEIIAITVR